MGSLYGLPVGRSDDESGMAPCVLPARRDRVVEDRGGVRFMDFPPSNVWTGNVTMYRWGEGTTISTSVSCLQEVA
jgi:hypothetical protein